MRLRRLDRSGRIDRATRRAETRAAAAELAAEVAEVDVAAVEVRAGCPDCARDHGAPVVVGTDPTLATTAHVSIAHAGDASWIVAAASPVGIDVERLDVDADRIRGALELVGGGSGHHDADVRRWTAIEAVLKADGRGLRLDPDAVVLGRGGAARIAGEAARYRLLDLEQPDGHALSVALREA